MVVSSGATIDGNNRKKVRDKAGQDGNVLA
jgi:hypothetical protein